MKVLSVRQPWAYLIVAGYKDIENRKWYTNHRGPLLIHASLGTDPENFMPKQRKWIEESGIDIPEDLPRGAIVGSVNLTAVRWSSQGYDGASRFYTAPDNYSNPWYEGPYGFEMEDAVPFYQPIPYRGSLGIRDANLDIGDYVDVFEMVMRPSGLRRSKPQGWA